MLTPNLLRILKKAWWIPLCIVLFLIGDRLGGYFLSNVVKNSQFRYARLYQGVAEADILLIGNSRGLIFYQPHIEQITNANTFNLSYNAMPVDLARVLVEDYLEKHPTPKMVLLDVSMCDRLNPQLIAGFSAFRQYSKRLDEFIKKQSPKSWYAGQLSRLFRYNSEVFQRTMYYWNRSDEDWLNDRVISQSMQNNVDKEEVIELKINEYLLTELDQLVRILEERGIELALVINPYYPPYVKRMQLLEDFIQKIENKTNRKVLNYTNVLSKAAYFADYQHLNKKGSIEYLNILKQDGVLDLPLEVSPGQ